MVAALSQEGGEARDTQTGGAASAAAARGMRLRYRQQLRVIEALLRHVGMDTTLASRALADTDGNWLHELWSRVNRLVPPALLQTWRNGDEPSDESFALIQAADGLARARAVGEDARGNRTVDLAAFRALALRSYRQRGRIVRYDLEISSLRV